MLVRVGDKQENRYWDLSEAAWVSFSTASFVDAPQPDQLDERSAGAAQPDEAAGIASG